MVGGSLPFEPYCILYGELCRGEMKVERMLLLSKPPHAIEPKIIDSE